MKTGPRKAEQVNTDEHCSHGCGQIAKFKNKSGKYLCSQTSNQCPVIKKKNSQGVKNCGRDYIGDYAKLPKEIKDRMNWAKGKTKETDARIKQMVETRCKNFKNGNWIALAHGVAKDPSLRWKRNKIPYVDSFGNYCILESFNELIVANELDKNNVKWFRPSGIHLSDGKIYEPDFYLTEYDVYLDPKTKYFCDKKYQGFHDQETQLEKIKRVEKEFNVRIFILWAHETESFKWKNIHKKIIE